MAVAGERAERDRNFALMVIVLALLAVVSLSQRPNSGTTCATLTRARYFSLRSP